MYHDMRPLFTTKFAGPAVTVMVKKEEHQEGAKGTQGMLDIIDKSPAGSVYVVVMEDGLDIGAIGGLLATGMKVRGFAGAVMDGSVRDLPQIKRIQFPVFSRGIVPSTSVGHYRFVGSNIPITCAGVKVNPGDIVTADEDGVVVVPRDKASAVLKKAQELDQMEPPDPASHREVQIHHAGGRQSRAHLNPKKRMILSMLRNRDRGYIALALGAWVLPLLAPATANAQLWTWTREQRVEYTRAWTGERFADGRPKVSDAVLERARGLSSEEITINWPARAGGRGGGAGGGRPYSQYTDGWQILHPGKRMVGRAFTLAFMPARPDLDDVVNTKAREKGIDRLQHQTAFDMLQPGDVLVVDLYGKKEGGTIVGDNLYYYVMRATKNGGLVVDGALRDLEGIIGMAMPAYYRSVHPSAGSDFSVAAVNVPIRIGNVTVMPGDVVFGDREACLRLRSAAVDRGNLGSGRHYPHSRRVDQAKVR